MYCSGYYATVSNCSNIRCIVQDITPQFLTALLPHVIKSVSDDDDDVRAVAAAALLPVAANVSCTLSCLIACFG